ncbi:MAG TPA: hypothetical protein VKO61_01420 [Candidatus Paceibacterota bacterium]|nr:hypothetical protein [Candidatus Paceibacterota bacterium]
MRFLEIFKKGTKAVDSKIKKIRRSDRKTKRNWLIGSTIIAMIIVISIWVGYLNLTVPEINSLDPAVSSTTTENIAQEEGSDSPLSVFSRGFKITSQSISKSVESLVAKTKNFISNTKDKFNNVKEYTPEN